MRARSRILLAIFMAFGLAMTKNAGTASKNDSSPRTAGASTRPAVDSAASGHARISSTRAGDIALKKVQGGKIHRIKALQHNGHALYKVSVRTTDRHLRGVDVDAASGRVMQVEDEGVLLGIWSFDQDIPGRLPEKWMVRQNHPTRAMAVWSVGVAPDAPTPPQVLNVHTENENATFNLALIEGTSYRNVDLRVQIRANSGQFDQGGGLIWRAKDQNNYYVCRINPLESNYRVYKVEDGTRTQLRTAEVKTSRGRWYGLRAVMIEDEISCYWDDQKILEVKDDTFTDAGMIGLWTKADASCSFDDVILLEAGVRGPPSAPAD